MRIALIGPVYPYRGGIAHYTAMLTSALRDQGHDVLLISFSRQYPQWLFPGKSDRDPSGAPLALDGANYWIDSLNPLSWLLTFRRIRRFRPDVFVLQWWTTFWVPAWVVFGVLTRTLLRRPLVFICHNVLPHEARRWDYWLAQRTLTFGDRFVVHSAQEGRRLYELLPDADVTVASLPVFDVFTAYQMSKAEARDRLRLTTDSPIVLFFGIVRPYKGLDDLLVAMATVRDRLEDVHLIVAGEFWDDKQKYLDLIEEYDLGDVVTIDDRYVPNEEAGLYFSAADVLVAPYKHVTGSAIVQTAHSFGLPTVATPALEKQDVYDSDGAFRLVISDIDDLADTILDELQRARRLESHPGGPCDRFDSWRPVLEPILRTNHD